MHDLIVFNRTASMNTETGALQSSAPVFFVCQRSSRKYGMPRDWGG